MNAFNKKIILLFLCFGYSYALMAQPNQTVKGNETRITRIVIASEPDYPPYCIIDKNGNPDGFSVDLIKAAAKAMNIEVEIKIGVWTVIMNNLAEGKIDALPLVGRTPERENLFDFTMPYLTLHGAIFVKKGNDNIKNIGDLANKVVAVMEGDNAEEFVHRNKISNTIIATHTFEMAFRKLSNGEVDAVITQRVMGIELLKVLKIKSVEPLDILLNDFRQDFCFAVKKGNAGLLSRLNEGLSIIIANKTYDKIHVKWFGPVIKEKLSFWQFGKMALYFLIPFIFLFTLLSIFLLRREVKRRTRSLQQEISEHKKTYNSLFNQQLLLEKMETVTKLGGWEYDVESRKITWTKGAYGIYGLTPSKLDSSNFEDSIQFFHPNDRKVLGLAFQNTIEKGEPYDLDLRFTSSDGISKWVKASGHPDVRDGKVVRLFGIIMDITVQKNTEDELRKLKDELEIKITERTQELKEKVQKLDKSQKAMLFMVEDLNTMTADLKSERQKLEVANKELEAFSYSVSHDLRAPLRAIHGFIQIIYEDYKDKFDAEGLRLMTIVQDNTKRMGQLIDDLLAFSRISRSELEKSTIDTISMVNSVFLELSNPDQKEKIQFQIGELPNITGDNNLFYQVWVNLLSNAIKFTSKIDSPKIEVGCNTKQDEYEFYVKDNGSGFDMSYVDKLFGVFQRLHSNKEFEGTGVGLAIVKRIITRHGGRIWATGEVGKGATLYFTVPK